MTLCLALRWVPLLQPLAVDDYWLVLMVPLLVAVSIVWKTIKLDDLTGLWRQVAALTVQFVILMAVAAAALWLITELV